MKFLQSLSLAALSATTVFASHGFEPFEKAKKFQKTYPTNAGSVEKRDVTATLPKRQSSPYLNNVTEKFVVDGTKIPDTPFDIGESYAGLLPISQAANETRQLFFWFFPSTNPEASDEITIWFNGGPGCSSLSGLLTENGPFTWQAGTIAPTQNPYTWVNLTNMLWVEQPVGVGFTQGTPNISNEVELGLEFIGFYKNFVDTFQTHGRTTYLSGESYAGFYVPYVADAFITAADDDYYKLGGVAINDPILGDGNIQQEVPMVAYVDYWAPLFNFNESFSAQLHELADNCGYTEYYNKYMTFPPPSGAFPATPNSTNEACEAWGTIYQAATEQNPCFNIYHITDTCPFLWNVLGGVNEGDYVPNESVFFNRTDVQEAINAPVGTNWQQCTDTNVFGNGTTRGRDRSLGPAIDGTLQRVIEYTNNTIIGVGDLDYILPTNGSLLAIQNVTWNGAQGFSKDPRSANEFIVPYHPEYNGGWLSGAGTVGNWGTERGLTFYTVQLAGHELPGYSGGAAYRTIELLLGRISDLSAPGPFTTQVGSSGNATFSSPSIKF